MSSWYFSILPAVSLLIAVLEADQVLAGQWMLSRPLLLGPIVGLACGDFAMGAAIGALTELFSLQSLPVGSVMPLNAPVAAGAGVLLFAGPFAVPAAAAFPAGLCLGWSHARLESSIRSWRAELTGEAAQELRDGGEIPWTALALKSIGAHVAATALLVGAGVAVLGPGLAFLWSVLPGFMLRGAETAFRWAPWIGLAALGHALWRRG